MIPSEIQHFLDMADESQKASEALCEKEFYGFSAAQSYYTIFYLAEALLLSKKLTFSSHSAVIAAYGKEFAKTGILDKKFHRYMIDAQERREVGHYGAQYEEISKEQAQESLQWAQEFKEVVKRYLK